MGRFGMFALLLSFLCFSCGSNDDSPEIEELTNRGNVKFVMGDVEKSYTKGNSYISTRENILLSFGNSSDELVTFRIPLVEGADLPKTFDENHKGGIISGGYKSGEDTYIATNGINGIGRTGSFSVTVTSFADGKISGTFTMTAKKAKSEDAVSIKKGVFEDVKKLPD
ncbi:hypothetical protein FUAX_18750 [Fulvitalea axinellae]|uniref:Lipoprotein n=1 Tax=Fulvitalea axinellae TaxID=1182444 RepID=A0AAU9D0G8_9BACT|nr:hypothetical protein FUAX_18750 [Fulvitalea axinellae]